MKLLKILDRHGYIGLKAIVKQWIGRTAYMKFKDENGITIYLPGYDHPVHLRTGSSDFPTFQQVFETREYDIEFGFEPRVIIDAGANIGLAAVYFSNRFPNARIFSIEPESSNLELLVINTRNWPNVKSISKALHHSPGLELQIVDEGIGEWGFTTQSTASVAEEKPIVGKVETIDITTIMEENGIDIIDILKIDIEGAEKTLFERNFESWLPKTRCLIVELHDRWYPGCSESVYAAIDQYNFSRFQSGENVVFMNQSMDS